MEKIELLKPLNEIIEDVNEENINENVNPLLFKSHSDKPMVPDNAHQFFKAFRAPSATVCIMKTKRNLFVMSDGPDDVQSSILKHTNSAFERMRISNQNSEELFQSKLVAKMSDIEMSSLLDSSSNAKSANALYLKSKLVIEMGFPSKMVDSIIKYDKDILTYDIQQIVDYLIKTEQGWTHKFIIDDENAIPRFLHYDEEDSSLIQKEKCIICGEELQEHKQMSIRNLNQGITRGKYSSNLDDQNLNEREENKFARSTDSI